MCLLKWQIIQFYIYSVVLEWGYYGINIIPAEAMAAYAVMASAGIILTMYMCLWSNEKENFHNLNEYLQISAQSSALLIG